MQVFAYTFANELNSLCWNYQGEMTHELQQFYDIGLDGYFTDFPHTARAFLDRLKMPDIISRAVTSCGNVGFLTLTIAAMVVPSLLLIIN